MSKCAYAVPTHAARLSSRTPAIARARTSHSSRRSPHSAAAGHGFSSQPVPSRGGSHPEQFPSVRHEALTLLHKTTAVLPRALSPETSSGSSRAVETPDFWHHILAQAYEDLNATVERPARIVVYAVDEWCGARDLVTALLEEPLNSDDLLGNALRDRWKDAAQPKITISHGKPTTTEDSSILQLPSSSYLSQFPVPVQITELAPPKTSHPSASHILDATSAANLYEADIPIIVCNALTTPLSTLLSTPLPANAIIVFTTTPSQLAPKDFEFFLQQSLPHSPSSLSNRLKILFVDPTRALNAVRALKEDSTSAAAVQRYQDYFGGSGISTITATLREIIGEDDNSQSFSTALRTKTAIAQIRETLTACNASVRRAKDDLDSVYTSVGQLNDRIQVARAKAEGEVLGIKVEGSQRSDGDEVAEALRLAEKNMKSVMDRFTFWRMLSRVDEISDIVGAAVQRAWCPDLEKKLILQTGRLSAFQHDLTKSSFSLLSSHGSAQFNSALLRNTLLQLKSSPTYPLTPSTLTHPLYTRRSQIAQYPTTRLHVAGQRAVLGMSGGIAGGVGLSWAGWLGWLIGSGEGLLGFVGMEPATAAGLGMLGAVASVRWAIGRWEKSKKKWWADWARVGEGLDRDLRATLDQTMRQKVVVVADSAYNNLLELSRTRKEEIEDVQGELGKLHDELATVETRT